MEENDRERMWVVERVTAGATARTAEDVLFCIIAVIVVVKEMVTA